MTNFGLFNELPLLRLTPQGALLDGGADGELLLPAHEVPASAVPGDTLRVFAYHGFDGLPAATLATPLIQVRQAACLKVVTTNDAGAFLDWGLPKNLLLPWAEVPREQKQLVAAGRRMVVCAFKAHDGRVAASARLDEFIQEEADGYRTGERVELLVVGLTELGARVIVNHRHFGLVHRSDLLSPVERGDRLTGYVKALRPDRKLTLSLTEPGYGKVRTAAQDLLSALEKAGGFLPLTDRTSPEEIRERLAISKKVFKQTLGALYKEGKVALEPEGIRLKR